MAGSLDKLFRRREWPVKVDEGPLLGIVSEITVKSLTLRQVDRCEAASMQASKEDWGDAYDAWQESLLKKSKARKEIEAIGAASGGGGDDDDDEFDEKEIPAVVRVRARGFYPPEVVRYGLVAVDGEPVPEDEAEFRKKIEDLHVMECGWIALKIMQMNKVIDDDPPGEPAKP